MVGTGPGNPAYLSPRARQVLEEAEVIVGYRTYLKLVEEMMGEKEVISTGMTREIERCLLAARRAASGQKVALVSGGDPGIYGMAGLVLEIIEREGLFPQLEVEVVPGITSASAAAALLGAPLMHDFAVISLSDLLTPWPLIERRLELAAAGDFVVVLYNPASHRRTGQIRRAREILLKYKSNRTPVGIVRNAYREGQEVIITDLENLLNHPIDMLCTVIVGNSQTRLANGFLITPRGYEL